MNITQTPTRTHNALSRARLTVTQAAGLCAGPRGAETLKKCHKTH